MEIPLGLICIRTLNAENRGILGVDSLLEFVKRIKMLAPATEIHVGWETKSISERLLRYGFDSSELYWAPIPAFETQKIEKNYYPFKIGFLGAARRNKGFELIPEIVKILSPHEHEFFIQAAIQEWQGYAETIKKINSLDAKIRFINGKVTNDLLLQELKSIDLLILPYQQEQYEFAGSGILFHGADAYVPTISFRNLGFSWDIENFKIGCLVDNFLDIEKNLTISNMKEWRTNILNYNAARSSASVQFLSKSNLIS